MTERFQTESQRLTETSDLDGGFLSNLARPSAAVTGFAERRRARFLATLLLVVALLMGVRILVGVISGSIQENPVPALITLTLTAAMFGAYIVSRSRYVRYAPFMALTVLVSLVYAVFFSQNEFSATTLLWLSPVVILASSILMLRDSFVFAVVNILFLLALPLIIPVLTYDPIAAALSLLIVTSALVLVLSQYRNLLTAAGQQELAEANVELQSFNQMMELRVQARTRDLAVAAEISNVISQILDLDSLLEQSVALISERFDLYYTQIYLLENETLQLRAGSGAVGRQLLTQGHTIFLRKESINGTAVLDKQAVIVPDTVNSPLFLANPALPFTRAEMSVPLLVQDRVVGVIDLQSDTVNSLSDENLPAFEVLAGQLAVAIENARLLAEVEQNNLFLDSVVANIPSILYVKEADDLRYLRVNRGMETLIGAPAREMIGKNHYDFYPAETAAQLAAADYAVFSQGRLVEIPEETVDSPVGRRILHTIKTPIFDSEGHPRFLLGISRDITERKQMESQLTERVNQLNLLTEIGQKTSEYISTTQFMQWVVARLPDALGASDDCLAAITLGETTYGNKLALTFPQPLVAELTVQGEIAGRIVIGCRTLGHQFAEEDSDLIASVGRRISNYIEMQSLVQQLQEQAQDLQKVAEISTAVATIQNPHRLVQEVARLTQSQFGLYQTAVFTLEEDDLVISAWSGPIYLENIDQNPRVSLQTKNSIIARAARSRTAKLVHDVAQEPDYLPHPLLPDTRSEIAVPLMVGDQVLGILDLQSDKAGTFTADDLNIFSTLAFQVAIALQHAYQYDQTRNALDELSSLQRVITGESWMTYMAANKRSVQGYVADRQTVSPLTQAPEGATPPESVGRHDSTSDDAFVAPVQIRGTTIGQLGIRSEGNVPISPENQALITAISQQVAEALERARLFEETELARAQTDQLYTGTERLVQATTMDGILQALVDSTAVQSQDRASLIFFDRNWSEEPPATIQVAAVWQRDGHESAPAAGRSLNLSDYPLLSGLTAVQPFVVHDINSDPRVDQQARALIEEGTGAGSVAFFPFVVADQWFGLFTCQSQQPNSLTGEDIRQISSLVAQAAAISQTQRLYEETEARAQQEQILRQVSERVYGAIDAETVLRTAVQEVGRVLGLDAFIYLNDDSGESDAQAQPSPLTDALPEQAGQEVIGEQNER